MFYLNPNSLNSIPPAFLLLPDLVVGIPVALAALRFIDVTPRARFQLNERPGIPVLLRLAIIYLCISGCTFFVPSLLMPVSSKTSPDVSSIK